ncbi:MAG TPA: hypothetical protein VKP30_22015 [Polyangiaceae bacterium]|nr:hypothetical protein [Polyangiaceae bacterium]
MIEPKRFLDAKGAPDEITYLLRVARREAPPQGLRSSTWQALVAKSAVTGVAVGAAGAATTKGTAMAASVASGSSATVSAHGIVSKGLLMLALKSVSVCGGVGVCAWAMHDALTETQHSEASAATTVGAASRAAASRAPGYVRDRAPEIRKVTESHEAQRLEEDAQRSTPASPQLETTKLEIGKASQQASPARVPSDVANERALARTDASSVRAQFEAQRVTEIRHMLRRGNGSGALQALAELDQQASVYLLVQEREALRIDAHLLLGHEGEARRLAQRFRQRYPKSPLATRWNK